MEAMCSPRKPEQQPAAAENTRREEGSAVGVEGPRAGEQLADVRSRRTIGMGKGRESRALFRSSSHRSENTSASSKVDARRSRNG